MFGAAIKTEKYHGRKGPSQCQKYQCFFFTHQKCAHCRLYMSNVVETTTPLILRLHPKTDACVVIAVEIILLLIVVMSDSQKPFTPPKFLKIWFLGALNYNNRRSQQKLETISKYSSSKQNSTLRKQIQ